MLRWTGLLLMTAFLLQGSNPDLLIHKWKAHWIRVEKSDPYGYGVYHFRRTFELKAKPDRFLVHVTADNRYQLYVNGARVAWGPARGDLYHWRYESVDIADRLHVGKNVLAAVVWNDGRYRAVAQISHETGFLLQGDTAAEQVVDTGANWVGTQDAAYSPKPVTREEIYSYVAVPPTERIDGRRYPWGWEQPDYDDSGWKPVEVGTPGAPRNTIDSPNYWFLVPRSIPLEEEKPIRIARVRNAKGLPVPTGWPEKAVPLRVPAHTEATLLLDQDHLTTAYPELVVSGGRDAEISLRYAEALWINRKRMEKGNRNEVQGKTFIGYKDLFLSDGGEHRLWRPLFWRTWRYIELSIRTKDTPLVIEDLRGVFVGYPFERKARFDGGTEELGKILDVGWRTARLCAHETYMDCPYFEQLQYAGDTRIQAMVSLYMSGDRRLMRNAIEQLNDSRTAEGATLSRAPSALPQYIPPFSLWWIGMVHDYWWYTDDPGFVRKMLPGVRSVLSFFAAYQQPNHSLSGVPWWNFLDWVNGWRSGRPPNAGSGFSAPLDLQLLLAYQWAAEMEKALGIEQLAPVYRRRADELTQSIRQMYWDGNRGLYADTLRHDKFSQHTNSLAVLAGLVPGGEAGQVIERALTDRSLAPASIYFRYYLHRAMTRAGMGDQYLEMLGPWRTMLADGLTTWAERDGPQTRSDCHAWGASPNIELFRIVLGIDSAAPGFQRVIVRPHFGKLNRVSGRMPHPRGEISVQFRRDDGNRLKGEIVLPKGVRGVFEWKEFKRELAPGKNRLSF